MDKADNEQPHASNDSLPEATTSQQHPLQGWSKEEKFQLYLAIKFKGSKNVTSIQDLPSKSQQEIEDAISHFKSRAARNTSNEPKRKRGQKRKRFDLGAHLRSPLASWANLLTDHFSFEQLETETATALRLLADLDTNIPPPQLTSNIDLRKVYHLLADSMEGKPLQNVRYLNEVINSCLYETALLTKCFIPVTNLKTILNNVTFAHEQPSLVRYAESSDESIVRELASLPNYNPLCIPVECLTPSVKI